MTETQKPAGYGAAGVLRESEPRPVEERPNPSRAFPGAGARLWRDSALSALGVSGRCLSETAAWVTLAAKERGGVEGFAA